MTEITIQELGARGDGVGELDGQTVFVPRSLPGEIVDVEGEPPHLDLMRVVQPATLRREPPCPHFERCGGCSLQHLEKDAMLEWKREQVKRAYSFAGIPNEAEPCIGVADGSRRRMTFAARRTSGELALGFQMRGSHDLVDIETCAIALPQIAAMLGDLRKIAAIALSRQGEIRLLVTWYDNGADIDLQDGSPMSEEEIAALVRTVSKTEIIRLSQDGGALFERLRPMVKFGDVPIKPPPGAFLQAVEASEAAMADLVCRHLQKAKRVADLFAGCGTFALRLAKRSQVHAVEVNDTALAALLSASGASGLRAVTTERRDLHALPLMAKELGRFEGVCLDPPRAGAEEQCREIARSTASRVAYVSCNPATLARDSALLIEGGYLLERLVPVDQFVYSHHIEAVALFSRPAKKRKRPLFG